MLCKKPYSKGVMQYGCGQCMPCRINRSRLWTGRMLLEAFEHPSSTFLTLTYNDEHYPGELRKCDLQRFIRRVRQIVSPRTIRYYGVGEYGEQTKRGHYHIIMFGLYPTEKKVIEQAWTLAGRSVGFHYAGTVEPGSISYTLSYMMKRLTKKGDPKLEGKSPEFAIMSKNPGLGYGAVERIVKAYRTKGGQAALMEKKWIEERYRSGGSTYPLGRYLKGKILKELGFETGNIEAHNEMQELLTWEKKQGKDTIQHVQERAAKVNYQRWKENILRQKQRRL